MDQYKLGVSHEWVAHAERSADGAWLAMPRVIERNAAGDVLARIEVPCSCSFFATQGEALVYAARCLGEWESSRGKVMERVFHRPRDE